MTSGFLSDLPLYASGLLTTLTVSLAGIALSVGIGIVLAAALRSPLLYISLPVRLYVEFTRGAPLTLVLFLTGELHTMTTARRARDQTQT